MAVAEDVAAGSAAVAQPQTSGEPEAVESALSEPDPGKGAPLEPGTAPGAESAGDSAGGLAAAPLDLSLPDAAAPAQSLPGSDDVDPLLPDFFGQPEKPRRTTVKGGIMLNESAEEQTGSLSDRVDGARIDVEVKLR